MHVGPDNSVIGGPQAETVSPPPPPPPLASKVGPYHAGIARLCSLIVWRRSAATCLARLHAAGRCTAVTCRCWITDLCQRSCVLVFTQAARWCCGAAGVGFSGGAAAGECMKCPRNEGDEPKGQLEDGCRAFMRGCCLQVILAFSMEANVAYMAQRCSTTCITWKPRDFTEFSPHQPGMACPAGTGVILVLSCPVITVMTSHGAASIVTASTLQRDLAEQGQ